MGRLPTALLPAGPCLLHPCMCSTAGGNPNLAVAGLGSSKVRQDSISRARPCARAVLVNTAVPSPTLSTPTHTSYTVYIPYIPSVCP